MKYFTTFFVVWNNGLREEIGTGLYSHPKRTQWFKHCELLFNQNKLLTYGYERSY